MRHAPRPNLREPRVRRPRVILAAAATAGAIAGVACPDGKFFAPPGYPRPAIPGQRAAIILEGDVETMVVDTDLVGRGGDLAWVIPTPQPAEVLPVERGMLETLELVTGPTFVPRPLDGSTVGVGLFFLTLAALWVLVPGRVGAICGTVVAALCIVSMLLVPALSTAGRSDGLMVKSASGAAERVEILSQGMAGEFEFTVLRSHDATGLVAWLVERGFAVPDDARPVLDWHVANGWSFVAGRLGPEARAARDSSAGGSGTWRPHPIGLRFRTSRAVYPMRLTGVGESVVLLRLFVLSDRPADCAVLDRTAVLPIVRRSPTDPPLIDMPKDACALGDPGILALAPGATMVTRLEGSLLPQHLGDDIVLEVDADAVPQRDLRWRELDRRRQAFWIGASCGVALLLGVGAVRGRRGTRGPRAWPWALAALGVAAAVGWSLHVRGAEAERERRVERIVAANRADAARLASLARGSTPSPELVSTLREAVAPTLGASPNPLAGGFRRHEASPGNWQIAWTNDGVEYRWFDAAGTPQTVVVVGAATGPAAIGTGAGHTRPQ